MHLEDFVAGTYQKQTGYYSFLPASINHTWSWRDRELNVLLEQAYYSLGSLSSYSDLIPNIDLYIKLHIKTEAHKSNRIEGTKTSAEEDLMNINDVDPEKRNDRIEVDNYIRALNYGIELITQDQLPVSNRLIREIHYFLLQGVRGEHKTPGFFRESQNWIGGSMPSQAVFVPPAHIEVPELMSDLEKFIHNDNIELPSLIRIAIIHYQFETIHPFLDGNGRIGRLIIPLLLLNYGLLSKPCFYISDFFERHRTEYYDALTNTRLKNQILPWIKFFLTGVKITSESAKEKFKSTVDLVSEYRNIGQFVKGNDRHIQRILEVFYESPISNITEIINKTSISKNTCYSIVKELEKTGYLKEISGYSRNKLYLLHEYFDIFQR